MSPQQKIVLASNNLGKIREFNRLLSKTAIRLVPQSDLGIGEAAETGSSFIENALIKARHATQQSGYAAMADDSGIEVPALGGRPGIHSARYAGPNASDKDNLDKLIKEIKSLDEKKRYARFVCIMVFIRYPEDPVPIISQGLWSGQLLTRPRGKNGFGYDPVFYIPTHHVTSAELKADEKNRLSHRGQALRLLIKQIQQQAG